jgi:endonuclease/exonuclease/phosphatase family metal-dependent hydrolase
MQKRPHFFWKRFRFFSPWTIAGLFLVLSLLSCFSGPPLDRLVVREHVAFPTGSPSEPPTEQWTASIESPTALPTPEAVTVMTLNLAHGRKDGFSQMFQSGRKIQGHLEEVAAVLRRESPAVVALQEADGPSFWSGDFDHVARLAEGAMFGYSVRGSHVDGGGLSYGTALLSRFAPDVPVSVTFAPSPPTFPKGFVASRVAFPGGWSADVVSVHLDFARGSVRRGQVEEMIRILSQRPPPRIVLGDFNSEWDDEDSAVRALTEGLNLKAWRESDPGMDTFPFSRKRLDWILISSELEFRDYRVVPDVLSDHLGVVAAIAPSATDSPAVATESHPIQQAALDSPSTVSMPSPSVRLGRQEEINPPAVRPDGISISANRLNPVKPLENEIRRNFQPAETSQPIHAKTVAPKHGSKKNIDSPNPGGPPCWNPCISATPKPFWKTTITSSGNSRPAKTPTKSRPVR